MGGEDIKLKMASAFPTGTKVTTKTYKYGQEKPTATVWTTKDGKNFIDKSGRTRSSEQLFPNGTALDATGDGKYDKKDLSIFNKIGTRKLSQELGEELQGKYYMKVSHEKAGGIDGALIDKKGNLSFTVNNHETSALNTDLGDRTNMTNAIGYTIDLPE